VGFVDQACFAYETTAIMEDHR